MTDINRPAENFCGQPSRENTATDWPWQSLVALTTTKMKGAITQKPDVSPASYFLTKNKGRILSNIGIFHPKVSGCFRKLISIISMYHPWLPRESKALKCSAQALAKKHVDSWRWWAIPVQPSSLLYIQLPHTQLLLDTCFSPLQVSSQKQKKESTATLVNR